MLKRISGTGLWRLAIVVVCVTVGSFVGELWLPLGLFVGVAAAAALGGALETVAVALGVAIGVPVIRAVFDVWLRSPWDLAATVAAAVVGLIAKQAVQHKVRRAVPAGDTRSR